MPLTSEHYDAIQVALLDAFSESELRRLARIGLGYDLDQIAGGATQTDRTFELVGWADRNGVVPKLIEGAARQNPTNEKIQALAVEVHKWSELQSVDAAPEPKRAQRKSRRRVWIGLAVMLVLLGSSVLLLSDPVRDYAATQIVRRGEAFAKKGDVESAGKMFEAALALHPPSYTPVYVWIEPGTFRMGAPLDDTLRQPFDMEPTDVVTDGYWIQRTEVSKAQYGRCVAAHACSAPVNNTVWNDPKKQHEPVTDVTWFQAREYADWAGGRLPTEAEWEKACHGGDLRTFPWGDDAPSKGKLNYGLSGVNELTPAGQYPAGGYGLYDMAGNALEWTSTIWGGSPGEPLYGAPYDSNDGRERVGTPELEHTFRVLRGGSFYYRSVAPAVRCADRGRSEQSGNYFRCWFSYCHPGILASPRS